MVHDNYYEREQYIVQEAGATTTLTAWHQLPGLQRAACNQI